MLFVQAGISIRVMLKSEPSLGDIGSALANVARAVDAPDRASAEELVRDVEALATLHYWTWVEPSDDLNTEKRLEATGRMALDIARVLLQNLGDAGAEVLRAVIQKQAPELTERFEKARTKSVAALEQMRSFVLFGLDEISDDNDPAFELPAFRSMAGPTSDLKL